MTADLSFEALCDDLGPGRVVHLWEPRTRLRAIVVIDNVACGPSVGGVRMAVDVTTEEVFRLARAMTYKNAAAGLPHGGGKAGIAADPRSADRERLIRAFGRAIATKEETGRVDAFTEARTIDPASLFHMPCDILIPAARPDCIHAENVDGIQARLILQGANIPATAEAEERLHARGVLSIPDFIANAGGVICAAVEARAGTEAGAFQAIADKIPRNTAEVLDRSEREGVPPRKAAEEMARDRVLEATRLRRAM